MSYSSHNYIVPVRVWLNISALAMPHKFLRMIRINTGVRDVWWYYVIAVHRNSWKELSRWLNWAASSWHTTDSKTSVKKTFSVQGRCACIRPLYPVITLTRLHLQGKVTPKDLFVQETIRTPYFSRCHTLYPFLKSHQINFSHFGVPKMIEKEARQTDIGWNDTHQNFEVFLCKSPFEAKTCGTKYLGSRQYKLF